MITRTLLSATTAELTFPGDGTLGYPKVRYTVNDGDLTEITDVSTNRTWKFTHDGHELATARSPLEPLGSSDPLVENTYTRDPGSGRITQVLQRVLMSDGGSPPALGDPVTVDLDWWGRPTKIVATARSGVNPYLNDETRLEWDPANGNLTKITEAFQDLGLKQDTLFGYDAGDAMLGLPTWITLSTGAVWSNDYDLNTGRVLSESSPENLSVPVGHPDRAASVSTTQYNSDGLPAVLYDPLGHRIRVTYGAPTSNSNQLLITLTFDDNSYRRITLDPAGRILSSRDELGVTTNWTYYQGGLLKDIRRAVGTPEYSVIIVVYNARGDVRYFDPPKGSAGRVYFDYQRYTKPASGAAPVKDPALVYEAQVTQILYPDLTKEHFGYNGAGEMAWRQKGDLTLVELERDEQHRVKKIKYPASGGRAAFNVTLKYDEFGRPSEMTDLHGTTTVRYDSLSRPSVITPPSPQKALNYSYFRDTTLQRWTSTVNLAGIGDYTYREDSKGRLSQILNPFSQLTTLEHDKDLNQTLILHANGAKEERTYTARDWLASITFRKADGTVHDYLN